MNAFPSCEKSSNSYLINHFRPYEILWEERLEVVYSPHLAEYMNARMASEDLIVEEIYSYLACLRKDYVGYRAGEARKEVLR